MRQAISQRVSVFKSTVIVELSVVDVKVRMYCMTLQQVDDVLGICYEASWAQNRALGNAAFDWKVGRPNACVDKGLGAIGQTGLEPVESHGVYGE